MLACSSLDLVLDRAGWDLHCLTPSSASPFSSDADVVAYQLTFPVCQVGPTGGGDTEGCLQSNVLSIGSDFTPVDGECSNVANYETAQVSICTPGINFGGTYFDNGWSIPAVNASTIVRWISDNCSDGNGRSEGYAQYFGSGHQIVLSGHVPFLPLSK